MRVDPGCHNNGTAWELGYNAGDRPALCSRVEGKEGLATFQCKGPSHKVELAARAAENRALHYSL